MRTLAIPNPSGEIQSNQKKMAVASGGFRHVVERQLAHIGVGDWFDAVVTSEDTTRHKPEPDVFLEAARRLGVAPERCEVYEDAEFGFEAARRAGMRCVDVRPFYDAANAIGKSEAAQK